MLLIIDTNILIEIDGGNEHLIRQIEDVMSEDPDAEPAVTWVNYFEFYYGKTKKPETAQKALEFLANFSYLGMDKEATQVFAHLRRDRINVTDVKDFDLVIASIAMANNAMLITKDKDFKRVKNLNVKILE